MPINITPPATRSRAFAAVAAVAAVLVLSACGGGADGDGVASAGGENRASSAETEDSAPLDEDAQALIFAECMRDNGVDMPDPAPGQEGLAEAFQSVSGDHNRATLGQAIAACQDLMPQYAQEQHGDDVMLALAECLREQGLDVSDEPFADLHGGGIDPNELNAAMEVCRPILTGGGE